MQATLVRGFAFCFVSVLAAFSFVRASLVPADPRACAVTSSSVVEQLLQTSGR